MIHGRVTGRKGRTALFLIIAVLSNSFGNLLLSLAMNRLPAITQVGLSEYLQMAIYDPFLVPGAALTLTYALVQIWLFRWADLSFVVPCIASSYIVSTMLAEFVLGERVQMTRWAGVLLICFGVFLVATTPVVTKSHGARPRG